jgi:endoglucanase
LNEVTRHLLLRCVDFRFGVGIALLSAACGGGSGASGAGAGATAQGTGGSAGGSAGANRSGGASGSGGAAPDASPGGGGAPTNGSGGIAVVPDAGPIIAPQAVSPNIVVDQFGYRTGDEKIAVIRSPSTGFDASAAFTPGAQYALIKADGDGAKVLEAAPVVWNGGAVDASSGDKAWWFDFSAVAAPGDYFVLDESKNVRSDAFPISDDVYRDVLAQSIRMFYYQRDGIAKDAKYAGAAWADGAAHMGAGQDPQCKLYMGTATKDLHGGWFDAGDQNKYTNWAASDVIMLLRAYRENPAAFFDDYDIPESGNGVPDVLDETKWELDWIVRMQNDDGSVLSIVGQDGAPAPEFGNNPNSAPSKATGPCTYGPANTSAALSTAGVFALASIVFKSVPSAVTAYPGYADNLAARAEKAWTWANANPTVTFANSGKVGAGEQETDDKGRLKKKVQAAALLFELTGKTTYRDFFDANYASAQFVSSGYVDFYAIEEQDGWLEYIKAQNATANVVQNIVAKYKSGVASNNNLGSLKTNADPYLAFLYSYVWGSNSGKASQGNVLADVVSFGIDAGSNAAAMRGAERYVHYIHGLNPLSLVYLSNMGDHGAQKSVTRFYHSWFAKGSLWDAVGVSQYGPPPGFLVGGPNPGYNWDGCCPGSCNGVSCGASLPSPPAGQPAQKAYKDFNDGWPLDSWSISEPDVGYQANYVRLLSKFVQ